MKESDSFNIADNQRNSRGYHLRFIRLLRKCQNSRGILHLFYRYLHRRMMIRYGLEIPWNCKIGKGLYSGHAYNITVNPNAEIGDLCNLHKGVTIGQQNRGKKKVLQKLETKYG